MKLSPFVSAVAGRATFGGDSPSPVLTAKHDSFQAQHRSVGMSLQEGLNICLPTAAGTVG